MIANPIGLSLNRWLHRIQQFRGGDQRSRHHLNAYTVVTYNFYGDDEQRDLDHLQRLQPRRLTTTLCWWMTCNDPIA